MIKIEFSNQDIKRKLEIPNTITKELAEETGIHVGDGSMNIYKGGGSLYSLEGDPLEKEYYLNFIGPLYKKVYNLQVRLRERKCAGVFGFQIGSKGLIDFKHKKLQLPLGPKNEVEIPKLIRNSDINIKAAFIRGFFDTDGGIYLEKKYGKLYPRIQLTNKSQKLMYQIRDILEKEFGFNLSIRLDNDCYRLVIGGNENFIKWMKLIGSNNPKNKNKYLFWLNSRRL